ncbi:MAG: hypothetical protein ACUVUP_05350 [Thermaceae bacterium]
MKRPPLDLIYFFLKALPVFPQGAAAPFLLLYARGIGMGLRPLAELVQVSRGAG